MSSLIRRSETKPLKIGVFDSGVGGLSVANAIKAALPELEVIYKEDKAHVPYGTKSIEQIYQWVKPIFRSFIDEGCQIIVVACNTVTTNLIDRLRNDFAVPLIGMEPAVKVGAAATKTGVIAVLATPRTLSSQRYQWLKKQFAAGIKVLEPNVADWALMIESNKVERQKVHQTIKEVIEAGGDQIVLGCTHYHWIEDIIKQEAAKRAQVNQPEQAVIAQLKKVINEQRLHI